MMATSFSMPTTVPLMTDPSCRLPPPNDSSSRAAKSSRVGAADATAVAIKAPMFERASPSHPAPDAREGREGQLMNVSSVRAESPKSIGPIDRLSAPHLAQAMMGNPAHERAIETMVQVRQAVRIRLG